MIDKIDLRIPARIPFTREFQTLYSDLRKPGNNKADPFHESRHYVAVGDLRPFAYSAILHVSCKHGDAGNHKLELLDVGAMKYRDMAEEISRIFDVDPFHLQLMRVDLCADVRRVPVSWFQERVRVRWKRFVRDIGTVPYDRIGEAEIETLHLGKRPNLFRIYNKTAERLAQYRKHKRREGADTAKMPSFRAVFGHRPDAVITRVERQFGGGRLPSIRYRIGGKRFEAVYDTFGSLREIGVYNPFEPLELVPGGAGVPDPAEYELATYTQGMGIRAMVERDGLHRTRRLLNKKSTRNGARILRNFRAFLPGGRGISEAGLFKLYKKSIERQLAA